LMLNGGLYPYLEKQGLIEQVWSGIGARVADVRGLLKPSRNDAWFLTDHCKLGLCLQSSVHVQLAFIAVKMRFCDNPVSLADAVHRERGV
jgi:hypothetical protein